MRIVGTITLAHSTRTVQIRIWRQRMRNGYGLHMMRYLQVLAVQSRALTKAQVNAVKGRK